MKKTLYLCVCVVVSCTNNQTTKITDNKTNMTNQINVDSKSSTNSDSLKDSNDYNYLSNYSDKKFCGITIKRQYIGRDGKLYIYLRLRRVKLCTELFVLRNIPQILVLYILQTASSW